MDPVQNFQVNQCPNPGLPDHRNDSPVVFFHANTYGDVSEQTGSKIIATWQTTELIPGSTKQGIFSWMLGMGCLLWVRG
jgi:hypothetical protein